MNSKCFKNEYLTTKIVMYLNPKEIISFLSCNKAINRILNPANNETINTIFYFYTNQKFFESNDNSEVIKYNKSKKKILLDSYWKSNINWKLYLSQITRHFKLYPDEKISNIVLKTFQIHVFLPELRKGNQILEQNNSSIHQIFSYDQKYVENCLQNYYDRYINDKYIINQEKNGNEVKILRTDLPFEEELKNFVGVYNDIRSNDEYKYVINNIINYDFENLENIYESIVNNNNVNKIIYFILWLNKSLIMYSMSTYESIVKYINDKDEHKFLVDYVNKYNDYINASLLINTKFQNVNIIMSYLNKYIMNNKNNDNKFSLYTLARKIFKKNIYEKVVQNILPKFSSLLNKYCIAKFNNNFNEEKEEQYEDDYDLLDIDELMEDEELSETNDSTENYISLDEIASSKNNEKPDFGILNNVMSSIVDMEIDQNNANGINHSLLKLSKIYEQFEELLYSKFSETIKQQLNEGKSVSEVFEILKKYFETNKKDYKNFVQSNNSLKIINRTKKTMLNGAFQTICGHIFPKIMNDFDSRLVSNMNQRELKFYNNEIKNEFKCDLSDYSNKMKMTIEGKVQEEINNIKTCLYGQNIKGYNIDDTIKLVNEYMDSDAIEIVLLVKKMIYFYFKELANYEEKDKKIECILTKDEISRQNLFNGKIIKL